MAAAQLARVLQQLRRRCLHGEDRGRNDGELLDRFYRLGDQTAFETLVQRYGSMVLAVCQRMLHDPHDSEDAFQATFLVVVHKGRGLLERETIGNWLYGVAYHTALKARAAAMLRRRKEREAAAKRCVPPVEENDWQDLRPLLDQELNKLTDRFREAVQLCDVLGKSRQEAAELLGIPEGTLSSRLTTARRKLAARLQRLGITFSVGTLAAAFAQNAASACVPLALKTCTVQAAAALAAGAAVEAFASPSVLALTQGVLKTMFLARCKTTAALLVGFVLLTTSAVGLSALGAPPPEKPTAARGESPESQPQKEQSASGTFVSYKDGKLTIRSKVGPVVYQQVGANYKTFQNNELGAGSKPVDTATALAAVEPGMVVRVNVEDREIHFGLDYRVIGTFVSYKDGKLTLDAAPAPQGFVQKPSGAVELTIERTIPVLESVDRGMYTLAGTADDVLNKVKKGTVVTARSETDHDRVEVVLLGESRFRIERYAGQSRATVRGAFVSWKDGLLRIRGKGVSSLAEYEYERIIAVRILPHVPIVESIDGGEYKPVTAEALNQLKEGTIVTIRKVEELVLEVQIGVAKPK